MEIATQHRLYTGIENHFPATTETIQNKVQPQFFILMNRETQQYRFFHASNNNARCQEFPRVINYQRDFLEFTEEIKRKDMLFHVFFVYVIFKKDVFSNTRTRR